MRSLVGWGVVVVVGSGIALGCGSAGPGSKAPAAGAAGQSAIGGGGGASSGAGGTNSGGITSTAGNGGVAAVALPAQPTCAAPAVACQGQCLNPAESKGGCSFLVGVEFPEGLAVSNGDVYVSTGFPFVVGMDSPKLGLYKVDGKTSALTALDTDGGHHANVLTVAGDTAYYSALTELRAVKTAGGTPTALVSGLDSPSSALVAADRLYFLTRLKGDATLDSLYWVPTAGGAPMPTALGTALRARVNSTKLVGGWANDLKSAPLPDATPAVEIVNDKNWPYETWWVDDQFVYFLTTEGAYERLKLDAIGATQADGELVRMLPADLVPIADTSSEILFERATADATGIYVMPLAGGDPHLIGVLGPMRGKLAALDAAHAYLEDGPSIVRLDR